MSYSGGKVRAMILNRVMSRMNRVLPTRLVHLMDEALDAAGRQLEALRSAAGSRPSPIHSPPQNTVAEPAPPPVQQVQTPPASLGMLLHEGVRGVPADELETDFVSALLYERLGADGIKALEAALTPDERSILAHASARERKGVALALGVHHQVPEVLASTGLKPDAPPESVHAMGRGWLAAGGSYSHADLVVDALRRAGRTPAAGMRALDFGCSSGRVVRVLQAAHPEIQWYGCDPNEGSIAWATEHLAPIQFFRSGDAPPLPLEEGALDFAFAISIWSHFAEELAGRWLEEMHRIIKPGGQLLFTTHGLTSIEHYWRNGARSREHLASAMAALYAQGFWFHDEFNLRGDHGVMNPQWGTAYFTSEWLLRRVRGAWDVNYFGAGREQGNQDLYVLTRRG